MSKFSKLIKNPKLFFADALRKKLIYEKALTNNILNNQKQKIVSHESYLPINKNLLGNEFLRKNFSLVIIDSQNIPLEEKIKLIKFQLRSIEKYVVTDKVFFISEELNIKNKDIVSYASYKDFYKNEIENVDKICANYLFVNLSFLFTKKFTFNEIYTKDNNLGTFVNPNRALDETFLSVVNFFANKINTTIPILPVHNICITNSMILTYFYKNLVSFENIDTYLLKFIPAVSLFFGFTKPMQVAIAYMDTSKNYIDKLHWLLAVRGTNRSPLGITINFDLDQISFYIEYLEMVLPHRSIYEETDSLFKTKE